MQHLSPHVLPGQWIFWKLLQIRDFSTAIAQLAWPRLPLAHFQQPIQAQEGLACSCDADEVFSSSSLGRPSPESWYGCAWCDITSWEAICTRQVPGLFLSPLRAGIHTNTDCWGFCWSRGNTKLFLRSQQKKMSRIMEILGRLWRSFWYCRQAA